MIRAIVAISLIFTCVGAAQTTAPTRAPTTAPTLKPGNPAPPLAVGKWVKGEPVTSFEPGKVYVVEFWATWCGPCKLEMPHLSQVQARFKDRGVIVIGQDVWEQDPAAVEPFVQKMGEAMNYRVATDDLSEGGKPGELDTGKMAHTWMRAAGKNGIPCSFVINQQGRIAWITHPATLEPILEQVVAGTFDPAKQEAKEARLTELGAQLNAALARHDADAALKLLDESQALNPEVETRADSVRFDVYWEKKDYDAATKLAAKLVDAPLADAVYLNRIAWRLATRPGASKADVELADRASARAVSESAGKIAAYLDTAARVQFERGNIDRAVELQTQVLQIEGDTPRRASFQETLDRYRAARSAQPAQQ